MPSGGTMKSITIRGIDGELDAAIKDQAGCSRQSVNQWLLESLKKLTGRSKEPVFKKYNDLDTLAGGWSKQETKAFLADIKMFEKIDKDIWQ
jgi:hypothetical protein